MLEFCGQDLCTLDSNGRVKLPTTFLRDFRRRSEASVVMHCLPEGALAVYPPDVWRAMREAEAGPSERVGRSVVARRNLRRFGALSQGCALSNQGRITIPTLFREYAELLPGGPVMLVGCEIGVEIWNTERWSAEMALVQKHLHDKGANEMAADRQEDMLP
jgi:division/cell wall cluster transcriptional repressor MraZ